MGPRAVVADGFLCGQRIQGQIGALGWAFSFQEKAFLTPLRRPPNNGLAKTCVFQPIVDAVSG